jgi:hypothetical protein
MTNTLTLSAELLGYKEALATARRMVVEAKRIEDAAKAHLNAALKEANATHGTDSNGTVVIELVTSTNTSTDRTILAALYPEALEASTKTTTYTKLVVK